MLHLHPTLFSLIYYSSVDLLITLRVNGYLQGWMKCSKLLSKPSIVFFKKINEKYKLLMDGMSKITEQAKHRFFEIDEVYKLVMDEMYNIVQFITNFEDEYSRICVVYVAKA